MANTYRWQINALDCHTNQNDLTDVVYSVHWSYIAEDENGNVASMIGVQSVGEPTADSFAEFDTLDLDTVVSWIEPSMDLESMQSNLDAQIAEIVAPTKVTKQLPVQEIVTEESPAQEVISE